MGLENSPTLSSWIYPQESLHVFGIKVHWFALGNAYPSLSDVIAIKHPKMGPFAHSKPLIADTGVMEKACVYCKV